jgi:hypothetical protein
VPDDNRRIKHHGLAHLVLIVALFLVAVYVFGGWTEGPLTSGLFLGAKAYTLVASGVGGNVVETNMAAAGLLPLILIFIINLIIYYMVAGVLIFLFNVLFFRKEKDKVKEK